MRPAGKTPSGAGQGTAAKRRWVSVCLGFALSSVLGYLAVRSVHWSEVWSALGGADYRFLALAAAAIVAMMCLRAWRWGLIVRPVARVGARPLFAITAVGFLAIAVIPFRIGELMRPYLLRERKGVPFPTGLATVAAERFLDGLAFAGLVVLATPWLPLPGWATPAGYALGGAYLLGLGLLVVLWLARVRMECRLGNICRRLMPGRASTIERSARAFLSGMAFLPDLPSVGGALLLSAAIWLIGTGVNYLAFMALGLNLPWSAAAALQILIVLGVLMPAAPGFVGSYQFFAVMGLRLYGVEEVPALSYAILSHATVLAVHIILGVTCGLLLQVGWDFQWRQGLAFIEAESNVSTSSKD